MMSDVTQKLSPLPPSRSFRIPLLFDNLVCGPQSYGPPSRMPPLQNLSSVCQSPRPRTGKWWYLPLISAGAGQRYYLMKQLGLVWGQVAAQASPPPLRRQALLAGTTVAPPVAESFQFFCYPFLRVVVSDRSRHDAWSQFANWVDDLSIWERSNLVCTPIWSNILLNH